MLLIATPRRPEMCRKVTSQVLNLLFRESFESLLGKNITMRIFARSWKSHTIDIYVETVLYLLRQRVEFSIQTNFFV